VKHKDDGVENEEMEDDDRDLEVSLNPEGNLAQVDKTIQEITRFILQIRDEQHPHQLQQY
jgi:hypothetical protein